MDVALCLPLATGLAAQAAIKETTQLEADIRWPNDLLLNNRKCGGILVESTAMTKGEGDRSMLRYVVIGVGINVNQKNFPTDLSRIATSISMAGGTVTRQALLIALLRSLDREIRNLVEQFRASERTGLLERSRQHQRGFMANAFVSTKTADILA
jgi:BirA family biotin operon repressor/biotin-[acetyl-CoA-carboxylase] ligase